MPLSMTRNSMSWLFLCSRLPWAGGSESLLPYTCGYSWGRKRPVPKQHWFPCTAHQLPKSHPQTQSLRVLNIGQVSSREQLSHLLAAGHSWCRSAVTLPACHTAPCCSTPAPKERARGKQRVDSGVFLMQLLLKCSLNTT